MASPFPPPPPQQPWQGGTPPWPGQPGQPGQPGWSGGPPPYVPPPARPSKPRPSGWWFVVGVVLLVAAVAVGAALFLRTLSGFTEVDAAVAADGAPHEVEVGTDGDRFLWVAEDAGAVGCAVVDGRTGEEIALQPVPGEFTRSAGAEAWRASARFDPGSGDLEVTCPDTGGSVEIGPAVAVGAFVGSVVLAIVLPLLLGLAGFAVLLVTGILWASRPARAST